MNITPEIRQIVGEENVFDDPVECLCYSRDMSVHQGAPDAVIFPRTTEQISAIMKLAHKAKVPVTARGTGTSVTGAVLPVKGGLLLDLHLMNNILEINKKDFYARLEPGVVRERLRYHLERAFSVDPASVVQDLAQDIRSAELENLLLGITAAQKGGMGYGEAVIRAAEEASERIHEEARIAIEETPVRMIIPMLLLLVPPFLVLALYPLLARLLALLNAPAGSAGGLW